MEIRPSAPYTPAAADVPMHEAGALGKRRAGELEEGDINPLTRLSEVVHKMGKLTVYAAASYVGDYSEKGIPNGHGRLTYRQCTYEGRLKNGYPHGEGTLTFPGNKGIFRGLFRNGEANGPGVLKMGRNVSTGIFEKGYLQGQGILEYANGTVYKGEFLDGFRHGAGVLTTNNGITISGRFMINCLYGYARIASHTGVFEGFFLTNEPKRGTYTYTNGSVAIAEEYQLLQVCHLINHDIPQCRGGDALLGLGKKIAIKDDERFIPTGPGRGVLYPNNIYEGGIVNGKADGKGIQFNHIESTCYEGEFVDGEREGLGRITDGRNTYEGLLEQNVIGIEDLAAGRQEGDVRGEEFTGIRTVGKVTFKGTWIGGKKEGDFTIDHGNGVIFRALFNNNIIHSAVVKFEGITHLVRSVTHKIYYRVPIREDEAVVVTSDGTYYRGQVNVVGKADGFGEARHPHGILYKGDFRDGIKRGFGILYTSTGVYEGEFFDNEPVAVFMDDVVVGSTKKLL